MNETRVECRVLSPQNNCAIVDTELSTLHEHLPDIERLLKSLLVKVQLAQGKEPTVLTRAERRRG